MNQFARNFILALRALFSAQTAAELARRQALARARKAAAALAAANAVKAKADDDYARLNYYQDVSWNNYQDAIADARRLPPPTPWVDPADYDIPCPTREQWATLTAAQKAAKGSVRF